MIEHGFDVLLQVLCADSPIFGDLIKDFFSVEFLLTGVFDHHLECFILELNLHASLMVPQGSLVFVVINLYEPGGESELLVPAAEFFSLVKLTVPHVGVDGHLKVLLFNKKQDHLFVHPGALNLLLQMASTKHNIN